MTNAVGQGLCPCRPTEEADGPVGLRTAAPKAAAVPFGAPDVRGDFPLLAAAATRAFEEARTRVAGFVGAEAGEVAFTSGATQGLNAAAWICERHLRPGDEVVLTLLEHHSNLLPWQAAAARAGARVRYLVPDRQGHITDEALDRALNPHARVVAFTGMSNVLGVVPPAERLVEAAHREGALAVLDCAQSIAHLPLNVHALDVDFAAFSGHKLYGPMGTGALYVRRELMEDAEPLLQGGGMVAAAFEHGAVFAEGPARLEAGTQNVPGALSLAAAVGYVEKIGFPALRAHEEALTRRMVEGLAAIPSVKLYGPGPDSDVPRGGIVAFNVRGVGAGEVAEALDHRDIAIRAGALCAQPLLRHLGVEALCRASIGIYTTERDIDRFLNAVESARQDATTLATSRML